MSEEVAKKTKEEYEQWLLSLTGVTGVGYNHSIHLYVEKATTELRAMVPKKLNGVDVIIVESGKFVPLIMVPLVTRFAERTDRYRPAPGGVSIGAPQITAGTLASRAIDKKTGGMLGLSNAHVLFSPWGTSPGGGKGNPVLQPGKHDGGIEDGFGELERWIPVKLEPEENLIDAAVFKSELLSEEIVDIGEIESPVAPAVGMNVVKSGRTSALTYGKIYDVNATVKVSGDGDALFKDQIIVNSPLLSPGDSGSLVLNADSLRTVGLGFAGSESMSVINKASNVERLLDIAIIPPEISPSSISLPVALGVFTLAIAGAQLGLTAKKRNA